MKQLSFKFLIIGLGVATFIACNSVTHKDSEVSGVYTREFSTEITNLETGEKIGRRVIRDTIFIEPLAMNTFRVSNSKWMLNDYDENGWQNMEHSDDRPMQEFAVEYSRDNKSLRPNNSDFMPTLYFDQEAIRKGKNPDLYFKIK